MLPVGASGTYNDVLRSSKTLPCTPCPGHLTTLQAGGASLGHCNACAAGYGTTLGGEDCATQCGSSSATYGQAGREKESACEACPAIARGFYFDYQAVNQNFTPAAVARPGAASTADCLAEFAQIGDFAWYMAGSSTMEIVPVSTFDACVDNCKTDAACQYLTYDYNINECYKKTSAHNVAR